MCRIERDLSQLPANTTQTYNMITGKGRLVFLVTQYPCSGVSVSDLGSTFLDNLNTCESTLKKYVSVWSFIFLMLLFIDWKKINSCWFKKY